MKIYGHQVLGTRTTSNNEQLKELKCYKGDDLFPNWMITRDPLIFIQSLLRSICSLLTGPHNSSETVQNGLFIACDFTF